MDLKEAYELRRREVLALTIENKKLKSGAYFEEERASYEKEIRRLQKELASSNKECSRYATECKRLREEARIREEKLLLELSEERRVLEDEWYRKYIILQEKVNTLVKQLEELTAVNSQQTQTITELENTNGKLTAQINRNYENSSIPSSQKPLHKKISNNREQTGKKPGAQAGHEGHRRKMIEATEEPIILEAPKEIRSNPDYYPTGKFVEKQVVDIQLNVIVKTYRAEIYRSHTTAKRVHAPFPTGVCNEVNYGSSVKALAFLLNNYCNVSIAKTTELIKELTGGSVTLSNGLVNKLVNEFSVKTEDERKTIFDKLSKAKVLYTDATVGRVNGLCHS